MYNALCRHHAGPFGKTLSTGKFWRVVYIVNYEAELVSIRRIAHRREVYGQPQDTAALLLPRIWDLAKSGEGQSPQSNRRGR
jgi:hypothetical protein